MFQWWCYPQRISTGRRREWISTELATLYSHTAASLWVLHILWDQFITTVQLTAFDHRGTCIWYFFLCCILCRISVLWPGVEMVPPAWEAQRHNNWASSTTRHSGKSWCLHLKSSVISSNPALASLSPGGPSWSTLATPSKSDHIQSTPHRWLLHLTYIYSFSISQAGMGILEDKISPFLV